MRKATSAPLKSLSTTCCAGRGYLCKWLIFAHSSSGDEGAFFRREAVEIASEFIDLTVEPGGFALVIGAVVFIGRGGELLLCGNHCLDELDLIG